ncbi:MAG: hypothetical protein ACRD1V_11635, partial [Vicinamibacterales bacterium]
MRHIAVAVPVPGLGALTYSVPDHLPDPPVGARVLVPLGARVVTGVRLGSDPGQTRAVPGTGPGTARDRPLSDLRPLVDVLDSEPFLPPQVVSLAAWVAAYYACGVGEA